MKFLLTHTILNKPIDPPIALDVEPQRRNGYENDCSCQWVFAVGTGAHDELIQRRLLLPEHKGKNFVVCQCLGKLAGEAVDSMLERALAVALPPRPPSQWMPKLERPLVSWDTESTGTDPVKDRIVSIGVCVLEVNGSRRKWETLVNPEMPIPPGATEIHGITDDAVKDAPKFKDIAGRFMAGLAGKDMLVYNGLRFDIVLLDESLRRAGMKLDLTGVRVIDAFGIYKKREPRDLSAFVKRYTGESHEGAHGAAADAEGTLNGYLGALGEYEDLRAMTLDEQAIYSLSIEEGEPADVAGRLYRREGVLYFAFGKNKDTAVKNSADYAKWMLGADFPGSTKDVLRSELQRLGL